MLDLPKYIKIFRIVFKIKLINIQGFVRTHAHTHTYTHTHTHREYKLFKRYKNSINKSKLIEIQYYLFNTDSYHSYLSEIPKYGKIENFVLQIEFCMKYYIFSLLIPLIYLASSPEDIISVDKYCHLFICHILILEFYIRQII